MSEAAAARRLRPPSGIDGRCTRSRSATARSSTTCRSRCRRGSGFVPPRTERHRQERDAPAHHRADAARPAAACSSKGDEISALDGPELARVRQKMGFLFQNAALFDSISVGENVAFPLRRHTQAGATPRSAARRATSWRRSGSRRTTTRCRPTLSGGMRKRAGLARALALDPPILLVDEPSAGLDPITADEIDELLLELKEQGGMTLVIVTHNIPSARRLGDELAMLHDGRIVARGTAATLDRSADPLVRAFMHSEGSG